MGIYLCSAIPKVEGVRVIGLWSLNGCNGESSLRESLLTQATGGLSPLSLHKLGLGLENNRV